MELLLLSQFNLDSQLPTFFEIYAKERLVGTLADAFRYAHATLADRSARAAVWLPYNLEIFYVLWALMERSFINKLDATFSENFFGLKRARIATRDAGQGVGLRRAAEMLQQSEQSAVPSAALNATPENSAVSTGTTQPAPSSAVGFEEGKMKFDTITRRDRILALLSVTLAPYLRQRSRSYYTWLTDASPDAVAEREALERAQPWRVVFNRAFARVYPAAHFGLEGVTLLFYLLFIFKKSPHNELLQYLTGVTLRRMTREDYMQMNAPGKRSVVMLAQAVLMAVVLGFRFLEWWGQAGGSASAVASATEEMIKPPPPKPPGESASVSPGLCPVCRKDVVNPATNTISGAVGCYPCMKNFVESNGRCPLTGQISTLQNLRRLYEM